MAAKTINETKIREALTKLFIAHNYVARDTTKLFVYLEALAGIPPKYVEEACQVGAHGKLGGNPSFLPTVAELYQYAEALLDREYREEKRQQERDRNKQELVQEAKNSPQQKERIVAQFKQLLVDMRDGKRIGDEPNRDIKTFNPAAPTFKPYDLDMNQAEITRCVMAYRRGQDWEKLVPKDSYQQKLLGLT